MAHRKLGDYELSSERRKDDGLLRWCWGNIFLVRCNNFPEMQAMSIICLIVVVGEVNY